MRLIPLPVRGRRCFNCAVRLDCRAVDECVDRVQTILELNRKLLDRARVGNIEGDDLCALIRQFGPRDLVLLEIVAT